jgi:hypothetical protein
LRAQFGHTRQLGLGQAAVAADLVQHAALIGAEPALCWVDGKKWKVILFV